MDEKNFNQEVSSLIRVKHKNIVRFLGYCADTQGKVEKYMGKMVIADVRQRLLCFEFMPNGSLDKHINGMLFLSYLYNKNPFTWQNFFSFFLFWVRMPFLLMSVYSEQMR